MADELDSPISGAEPGSGGDLTLHSVRLLLHRNPKPTPPPDEPHGQCDGCPTSKSPGTQHQCQRWTRSGREIGRQACFDIGRDESPGERDRPPNRSPRPGPSCEPWQPPLHQPSLHQTHVHQPDPQPPLCPDPTYLRGISGGEQPTQAIAGQVETETGVCLGFVSDRPDHRLTLEQFFDYLNVQVLSEQATVMVIKGPGGTWCSDNRSIPGASVAGQWLPGRYEIWVGTAEADSYAPYRLQISEVQ
ncbi:MAG: hypothetical protein HC824_20050 [Synechococcales cyanobacterium RM1_1_8]|nr:hypothetical protein [Synechococcales cyanobacterium RM1_1_8]